MSEWKGRKFREERKKRGEDQGAEEKLESWPSIPYFHKSNDLHLVLSHIKVLLLQK